MILGDDETVLLLESSNMGCLKWNWGEAFITDGDGLCKESHELAFRIFVVLAGGEELAALELFDGPLLLFLASFFSNAVNRLGSRI